MKSYIAIIAFGLLACTGCNRAPKPITIVTLIVDQTGDAQALPAASEIQSYFQLMQHSERGGIFNLQCASDLEYAPSLSFEIEPQPLVMQNPNKRRKEINDFLAKIQLSMAQMSLLPVGKSRSQIYTQIIQSLNAIAAKNADEKLVYAVTDLCENSSIFSVYDDKNLHLIVQNPDSVIKILSKQGELGDMSNVSVQFSYTGKDFKDGQRYALMASLFKKIIEAKHGKVLISGGSFLNAKK